MRTFDQEFSALKASLGIDSNPSYVIRGPPSDYTEIEVADCCKNLNWPVNVEATSRRFELGRTRWLVRASAPPTTNSIFCFTEFHRLRITLDPTAQIRSAPPLLLFRIFRLNLLTRALNLSLKVSKGKGKGGRTTAPSSSVLEQSISAPPNPRPVSVPPPFIPIHTPERRPCLAEMQRSRTPRVPNARVRFPDDSPAPSGESYDALAKRLAATDAKLEQLAALLQQLAPAGLPNVPPADVPAASNAANEPRSMDPDAYMSFEGAEFPGLDETS